MVLPHADDGDREGLAAYADQPLPEDLLGASDVIQIRERDPAVIENLRGLDQELQGSVLAKLQDWLRTLVKVTFSHGTATVALWLESSKA